MILWDNYLLHLKKDCQRHIQSTIQKAAKDGRRDVARMISLKTLRLKRTPELLNLHNLTHECLVADSDKAAGSEVQFL